MAKEYIERDKSLLIYVSEDAYEQLQRVPAADVVPVRHGRWEWYDSFSYRCSACKKILDSPGDQCDYHYRPKCGALMDKDGDGE